MASPLRVLVLSAVFPNPAQPIRGVFVKERMRRLANHCRLVVVAPIAWFPLDGLIRGVDRAAIPTRETRDGLCVYHPRFFCIPRYFKWLDGLFYVCSLLPFLWKLRREFPFDLIDAHFAYPDGMAAALLGKFFGCPVVITLRGSIVRLSTYRLHRPQLRWALGAATRVLSVSEALKQVAVALGIPAAKIRVIPNGVDTQSFFPMDQSEARRTLGLPLHRTILLSVGTIDEHKGHHRVIGRLPVILSHHPDLLHVIIGVDRPGQSSRRTLERLIARLGLADHVFIAGERPHDEVPLWLAAADLFCLATKSEGWPNAILEALACGRPVVATRVGGVPEIVTREAFGILVPPGDDDALANAIAQALKRRWDPEPMVAHARAHSWEAAALKVVEEFRRIAPPGALLPAEARPSTRLHPTED